MSAPRRFDQRRADTLARLEADVDVWVATARGDIQAWRAEDELPGRELMREGAWLG